MSEPKFVQYVVGKLSYHEGKLYQPGEIISVPEDFRPSVTWRPLLPNEQVVSPEPGTIKLVDDAETTLSGKQLAEAKANQEQLERLTKKK